MAFKAFAKSHSGATAVIFTLALIPILGLVGAAIDYSRGASVNQHIQDSTDAAVLAAASMPADTKKNELKRLADTVFEAHISQQQNVKIKSSKLDIDDGEMIYEARAEVETTMMAMMGHKTMDVNAVSVAQVQRKGLELVIVLDVTNSMFMGFNGVHWNDVIDGVEDLLEELDEMAGQDFYVSFVSMGDRVNIGATRTAWLSTPPSANWTGCVAPREQPQAGQPYALTDDLYTVLGFEPQDNGTPVRFRANGAAMGLDCPDAISGPYRTGTPLIPILENIKRGGTGRFDTGMAWAWRLLSPNWQNEWGVANYPALNTNIRDKVVLFISDGNSTIPEFEMNGGQTWGWNNYSAEGFENLTYICEQMHAQGIEILMAHEVGNDHATDYFKQCADDEANYLRVTETEKLMSFLRDKLLGHYEARLVK